MRAWGALGADVKEEASCVQSRRRRAGAANKW